MLSPALLQLSQICLASGTNQEKGIEIRKQNKGWERGCRKENRKGKKINTIILATLTRMISIFFLVAGTVKNETLFNLIILMVLF